MDLNGISKKQKTGYISGEDFFQNRPDSRAAHLTSAPLRFRPRASVLGSDPGGRSAFWAFFDPQKIWGSRVKKKSGNVANVVIN